MTDVVDVQIFNCLLECRNFPQLIDLITGSFTGHGEQGDNGTKSAYQDGCWKIRLTCPDGKENGGAVPAHGKKMMEQEGK